MKGREFSTKDGREPKFLRGIEGRGILVDRDIFASLNDRYQSSSKDRRPMRMDCGRPAESTMRRDENLEPKEHIRYGS